MNNDTLSKGRVHKKGRKSMLFYQGGGRGALQNFHFKLFSLTHFHSFQACFVTKRESCTGWTKIAFLLFLRPTFTLK